MSAEASKILSAAENIITSGKNAIGIGDNSTIYFVISLLIIAFIIFLLVTWVFYTLNKKGAACKKLNNIYLESNKFQTKHSIFTQHGNVTFPDEPNNYFNDEHKSLVKNYYIKTAYNSCCGDGYKNNFVNICALEKCIKQGARCLDFEIYSYNGEPIVAASTANNNSIKETYNYIKIPELFNIIKAQSFDMALSCQYDPMFLNFRIMSENKIIYDKMGEYIKEYLNDDILDTTKYNYLHNNNDNDKFITEHIGKKHFVSKFIIMVHTLHNNILDTSDLAKYVNLSTGYNSVFRIIRYKDLVAAGSNNPMLVDESHRSLLMVLPDINNSIENYDPILAINNGCQFIGMKFQNIDSNLISFFNLFTEFGSRYSFVLKPSHLRMDNIPAVIPTDGETTSTTHKTFGTTS
tara:strand:- start:11514 stop:12731 length:1218 start_codon:yes stop_codon:yes gene_type:complete